MTRNKLTLVAEEGDVDGRLKRDPDQYMPIASLMRIMRRVLPDDAKVADDAKETIQECVSEFITFITREANESCHREYRRTVTPNDVISAMADLGFREYVEPLTVFINKHRAQEYYPPRTAIQQPPAQMPPPALLTTTVAGYEPSPPQLYAVDGGNYSEMRDYFMGYRGGGGEEFDPFNWDGICMFHQNYRVFVLVFLYLSNENQLATFLFWIILGWMKKENGIIHIPSFYELIYVILLN